MIKLVILFFILVLVILVIAIILYQNIQVSYKNTVSGIILLGDEPGFNSSMIERELLTRYKIKVSKKKSNDGIVIFSGDKYRIVILAINAEIPSEEMDPVCKISHIWKDASEHISRHLSHINLSVSSDTEDLVELNLYFTKVASTLLRNTKSIGIYLEVQSLVLPSEYYIKIADSMSNTDLPISNWVYIGLREANGTRSGFTIGLKEFGYREIEISESEKSFEEIYKILYELSHHVLKNRKALNKGEIFDLSKTEKLLLEPRTSEFRDTESMHVVVLEHQDTDAE